MVLPMSNTSSGKGLAIFALILALAAVAGMAFVYIEPIMAFDKLKGGAYNFPPTEQAWMMRMRMREAGIPLIASSGVALLAIILGSRRKGLGKVAMFLGIIALAAAGYVWAMYGSGIINAL